MPFRLRERFRRQLDLPCRVLALATTTCLLAACAVGPDYRKPVLALPDTWQAALPHGGQTANLLDWWGQFNDPALVHLLQTAEADSPSLDQAAAAIEEARAAVTTSRAAGLPSLSGTASATRAGDQQGVSGVESVTSVALDAAWELDLFGGVRRATESARAQLAARQSDWHAARVSLAAEVASDYTNYRACRLLVAANVREAESQRKTADITAASVNAGFTAPADGALANASAANASSSLVAQQAECDLTVKALVALTGMPEPALRELLGNDVVALPMPTEFSVTSMPVVVLSQRPDVSAAERTLAAASADIGSAEANRYPRLLLNGSIGLTTLRFGGSTLDTQPWSFGPSLSLPLFDGGKLRAEVRAARARYDNALATYKQSVRGAVEEVEQALVRLDSVARRATDAQTATDGYQRFYNATEINWRAGGASLLNLEDARRSAITSELNLIGLQRDRVLDWIALYKALGGGWQGDAATSPANNSYGISTSNGASQ